MSQLTTLDASELTAWLTRMAQTIDRSLREPARGEALAALAQGLPSMKGGFPVLGRLALVADCLRVAHLAIDADGRIDADELGRVGHLASVAARVYALVVPGYEAFADGAPTPAAQATFLRIHRADTGPFGSTADTAWRGLALARQVEHSSRNAAPLRDHERMLSRVMDAVFAGRATDVERSARRTLRERFEPPATTGTDPRTLAFCRDDGPEVFSSVAHGSQVHERDPFDVEAIHGEARELLHRLVDRATTPEHHHTGHGRTLLLLGESGAGKTHLLRALRTQVHGQRLGYVGYLQMTSEVGDYTRYVLRNLIDSMERPYDRPSLTESALMYLSDGLVQGRVAVPPDELERLRTAELDEGQLDEVVGRIVDRVLRTDGLDGLEVDLLHALLLLQRRDPALQRRVIRFLRCEALTAYDRKLLGGLTPREQPEDPLRTLAQLARIMYELHMAALVLVVDQLEETIPDGVTITRLQLAFDSLRGIADAIPSAVVVISCLDDVYTAVRPRLSRSLVDRLEHDPGAVRLTSQRQPDEIEQMLARRLEHLYATFDVPWRDDEPLYPFTATQLEAVSKFRARDVLAKFRAYHAACIAARGLVPIADAALAGDATAATTTAAHATAGTAPTQLGSAAPSTTTPSTPTPGSAAPSTTTPGSAAPSTTTPSTTTPSTTAPSTTTPSIATPSIATPSVAAARPALGAVQAPASPGPAVAIVPTAAARAPNQAAFAFTAPEPPPEVTDPAHAAIERAWNDALAGSVTLPDEDAEILDLVADAIRDVGHELGATYAVRRERAGAHGQLVVDGPRGPRVLAVVNQRPQGGHLGRQLDALRALATTGATPIALRSSDFQFAPKTQISQQVGGFLAAGGKAVVLEERELRTVVLTRTLAASNLPAFESWRRSKRPLASLTFLREALALDTAHVAPPPPPEPPAGPDGPPIARGEATGAIPGPAASPSGAPPASRPTSQVSAPIPTFQPDQLRLGVSTTLRAEPRQLPLEQIKTHVAFLGTTGSGKTTAALTMIEQLLERGVSALLLDRKGDLARYASPAWWNDANAPDHARRVALRGRIDVALFTPGNPTGRPLRLPLLPSLADAPAQERSQLASFATGGLAAMMGYGSGSVHTNKRSVLQCAIQLHADDPDISLDVLLDTIDRPDPELLRTVGSLQRFFAPLSEDLQSLKIQRGPLLAGEGEPLDVSTMLPPPGDRPRLTIINTAAITEVAVLQFWVSRLLVELARLARRRPTKALQGVAFFDEADAYVPAVGSPPTKEPMFDLLRRARSGGLGILLATQNPGDFDYKARDNIGTWLVGKVAQDRAIEKMRNLIGAYPNVGPRLATQSPGNFFVLAGGQPYEVRCDRSMMTTEQLAEAEVSQLARATRP